MLIKHVYQWCCWPALAQCVCTMYHWLALAKHVYHVKLASVSYVCVPCGDAAEDGVEVVAAEGEEHAGGGDSELCGILVALTVRVDKVADLWQQLLHKHRLIQTHTVLRLLQISEREEVSRRGGGGVGAERERIRARAERSELCIAFLSFVN